MKSSLYKIASTGVCVLLMMLMHTSSQAQMYHFGMSKFKYGKKKEKFENNRPFAAIQLGYNYTLPYQIEFYHYFAGNDFGGRNIPMYEYTRAVEATAGPSIHLSTHFPLLNFTDRLTLAMTLGAEYNSVSAETGNILVSPYQTYSAKFTETKVSVPIGVAIKYGADASLVKSDRFSGSLGIAAAPSYVMTQFGDYFNENLITITPFVFAEVGVMGGFNWKIRATCMPFGITGFKRSPGQEGMDAFPTQTSIKASSQAIFQVGLAIQPLAFIWEKYHW